MAGERAIYDAKAMALEAIGAMAIATKRSRTQAALVLRRAWVDPLS